MEKNTIPQKNLKYQRQKLTRTKYLSLKKLFLCFQPTHLVMRKLQVLLQLEEKILLLVRIKLVEK